MKQSRSPYGRLSILAVLVLLGLAFSLAGAAAGEDGEEEAPASLGEALKAGKVSLNLRYRYETVSQDGFTKDANASTLRTTLSYRSKAFHGFSVFAEAEDVTAVGSDDYNNAGRPPHLSNGVTDRPVVADPEVTEVNQAYLSFAGKDTRVRIGREEIVIGNVRFVGNVGWRQNHQTYDALSLVNGSLHGATLTYVYVDNVNRIFGDNKPMSSHLLNGTFKVGAAGQLAVYGYFLDYDELADATLSTATFGVSFANKASLGGGSTKLVYDFEYATQSDHGDNPAEVDADYYRGEIGAAGKSFSAKVGYEVLEGSPADGKLTTPLATLHKWNGWADKFLATPANGLEDVWLAVHASAGSWKLGAIYHDFSANTGSASYGEEIDLLATYTTSWKQSFGVKAALYSADTHASDTDKIWGWTAWKF